MARTARASVGGICYHALNRGNQQQPVFHKTLDYRSFVKLLAKATDRIPMRVLGYCLMPNHFHLVLQPYEDGDLSRWMQWLLTSHVRRYHRHYGSNGHVWQGRFKAFPIQQDEHLLTVLRYIERNPLRARLVSRAEHWPWSSLRTWAKETPETFLSDWPIARPIDWLRYVNRPQTDAELEAIRSARDRGAPFGEADWVMATAIKLGLEANVRPRGRPPKK